MKISSLFLVMALGVLPAVQGGRKCTNPKVNDGESYTEDCLKMTCKAGVWRSSLDASICCYNSQPYHPNTTITATEDGCATAVIYCRQEDNVATVVLQVENHCGEHSTEQQVQEIKHLLVQHMEQTDCKRDSPAPTSASSTTTTTTPTSTSSTNTTTTTIPTSTSSTTTTTTHDTEGILLSGGFAYNYKELKSVELFIPETGQVCSFPNLPGVRQGHSMNMVGDDLVVCGGREDQNAPLNSCVHLSPPSSSVWTSYATMRKRKAEHTAWVAPSGELLLVGGDDAEIVNAGTSTGREIRLEHNTSFQFLPEAENHCGIDAEDSVIITGGRHSERIVRRYNLEGHVENLPEMNQGRSFHGCSSYLSDGSMVLIVAGGLSSYNKVLSSTERMAIGAAAWTTMNALTRARFSTALLTVGNLVYMTGGVDDDGNPRSDVYVLDGNWRHVEELKIARGGHAATMIDTASFMEFCN